MVNSLSILGSTGSIGTQTLDVADKLNLKVSALTASTNIKLLEEQVRKYKPELAVVFNEEKAKKFKDNIKDTNTRVLSGMNGLIEAATLENADLVVNSVVGMVGLKPTAWRWRRCFPAPRSARPASGAPGPSAGRSQRRSRSCSTRLSAGKRSIQRHKPTKLPAW